MISQTYVHDTAEGGGSAENPAIELASRLRARGRESTLILTDSLDENLLLAARNLPNVLVLEAKHADPLSLVHYGKVLITRPALSQVQEMLG